MRLGWVVLAAVVAIPQALAQMPGPVYPPDVGTFIGRVALCGDVKLEEKDTERVRQWRCDQISADRSRLLARYGDKPELVEAIKGNWRLSTFPSGQLDPSAEQ